ncbi:hypothetical protein [uncultured Thiodictyon sp.]|nr:hypothetical protein [uncultured Thiodictyon sp.]
MTLSPETLRRRLIDHTCEPYRAVGRFACHLLIARLGEQSGAGA